MVQVAFGRLQKEHCKGGQMLKKEPIDIDKHNWYYEENKHICLCHQVTNESDHVLFVEQINIPWKRMLESVCRKYNIDAKARRKAKRK